tara:strand:+ start:267 stop:809 length:543 start_codon:yes stop_codon:yes gene_type:complete
MLRYSLLILLSFNMLSFEILPDKDIDIDSWRFVKDQVMGGKSDGSMILKESTSQNFDYISAKGNVSTDGGGFLMFRKEIDADNLNDFSKIKFKARGNNEKYFIHIKTKGSIFPWVRYLSEFDVTEEWQDFEIEFDEFIRYSNKNPKKRNLNPKKIKLIGVEASGRDFEMDIDIASMSFSK